MARTVKRIEYVLTDTQGNMKDEKGYSYGSFLPNEKKMAYAYAAAHGLKVVERESLWWN